MLRNPTVRAVLGQSVDNSLWGIAPLDLAAACHNSDLGEASAMPLGRDRSVTSSEDTHVGGSRWARWYRVPNPRHNWGVPQYALHASWGDLFLDLIYVGVAFQLGTMIKYSFYSCDDGTSASDVSASGSVAAASASGSVSASASGSAGRRLASASAQPECIGLGYGVLYMTAIFVTTFNLWWKDTVFRASFESSDATHRVIDLVQYCFIVIAAGNILPLHVYIEPGSFWSPASFIVPVLVCSIIYWLRWLELALVSHKVSVRRQSASQVIDQFGTLALLTAAVVMCGVLMLPGADASMDADADGSGSHGDGSVSDSGSGSYGVSMGRRLSTSSSASSSGSSSGSAGGSLEYVDLSIFSAIPLVLILSSHYQSARIMWKMWRPRMLPKSERDRFVRMWPREATRHPINVEFVTHRYNEFMMLMLGETVLQLVIADVPTSPLEHYVSIVAGFVTILTVLHAYQITEPHHADGHATRRSIFAGVTHTLLLTYRAIATMIVGVSIKLVLYAPVVPDAGASRMADLRMLHSGSLVASVVLQMLMTTTHAGLRAHLNASRAQPVRLLILALRILVLGGMFAVAIVEMQPWAFALVQAAAALVQWGLLFLEVELGLPGAHGHGAHGAHGGHGGHGGDGGHMTSILEEQSNKGVADRADKQPALDEVSEGGGVGQAVSGRV